MMRLREIIQAYIPDPNRTACMDVLDRHSELINNSVGSSSNHQSWTGGYIDHIEQTMNICIKQYDLLNSISPLNFELHKPLTVLFLHDIEKPWKYASDGPDITWNKESRHQFRINFISLYNFSFDEEMLNAIKYTEGEILDYNPNGRTMNEMASLCHICDIISSRIWHSKKSIDLNLNI